MSKHIEIKDVFDKNIEKISFIELCKDENTGNSMITSKQTSYKFDDICQDIKTSDTVFFFKDRIDFIEFKDVNSKKFTGKNKREFIRQLRLKVIETYITFYNYINYNSLNMSKDDVSDLTLNYYFVFNKDEFKTSPTLLNAFSAEQIKWTKHYSKFFNIISFLDHELFLKKFKIK